MAAEGNMHWHAARWFAASLGAGAAMLIMVGAARAQDDSAAMSAARDCLCAEQAMMSMRDAADAEHRKYDESRETSQSLTREAQAAHGRVNTENRDDIEAFTALLAHRDAAKQAFDEESTRYIDAVDRFHAAVDRYNRQCLGRLFDPGEMASLRENLSCEGRR
jgi:hypothetical protein